MYFQALICHTDILIIDPSLEITDLLKLMKRRERTRTKKKSIHQNKTIITPGNTTNQTANE